MRLTEYTDSLLRVVFFLAHQKEKISKKELLDKLAISSTLLEKILKALLAEGILQEDLSKNYSLSRRLEDIRLYDLLIISEKSLSIAPSSDNRVNTYRSSPWYITEYTTRYFYRELQNHIEISTKSMTLKSVLQIFKEDTDL